MREQTYRNELGAQLRDRRKLLGLNQTEVADLAATTQRSVSQVETGKATSIDLYGGVAHVLGMRLVAVEDAARRSGGPGGPGS